MMSNKEIKFSFDENGKVGYTITDLEPKEETFKKKYVISVSDLSLNLNVTFESENLSIFTPEVEDLIRAAYLDTN